MSFRNEGPKKRTYNTFWLAYCIFFSFGGVVHKIFSVDSNDIILSPQKYSLTICAIVITKFYRLC